MAKRKVAKKKRNVRSSRRSSPRRNYSRSENKIPLGVKIIAILGLVSAVLTVLMGVVIFIAGLVGGNFASQLGLNSLGTDSVSGALIGSLLLGSLILGGILFVLWGIVEFFIARGLWRGRNWARIVVGIFMVLGFISAIFNLNFFGLIVTALVGYYIWFSKECRNFFK